MPVVFLASSLDILSVLALRGKCEGLGWWLLESQKLDSAGGGGRAGDGFPLPFQPSAKGPDLNSC